MKRRSARVLLAGLLFSVAPCEAQKEAPEKDIIYNKSVEYEIEESSEGTYALSSRVAIDMKFLSERAAKTEVITIGEPFYATVTKVNVKHNGSSVSNANIVYGVAPRTDVFLSDSKQYTVALPSSMKPGDVISYSYRQQFADVAFLPIQFVPNIDYVDGYRISFQHPEDMSIDFEFYFPLDTVRYTIDRSDAEVTKLSFTKLDHIEGLKYYSSDTYRVAALITLKKGERAINPTRARDFVAWYSGQADLRPMLDSTNGSLLADRLQGRKSMVDTLAAIHDFVRATIRYIADERGINAFVARHPSITLKQQYGDCKDRAALVAAIAREYSIPVHMATLQSAEDARFEGVHVGMFNHVICAYQSGMQTLFFDPTAKYCEFGNLPDNDIGRRAFILDPVNPRFETIRMPLRDASLDIQLTAHMDSLNNCTGTIVLRNDLLSGGRHAQHDLTDEKFVDVMKSIISTRLYQIKLNQFKILSEDYREMRISVTGDLSRFVIASEAKSFVPQTPFTLFDNDILERQTDPYPLDFSATENLNLRLVLYAPNTVSQPESLRYGGPEYSFATRSSHSSGRHTFEYQYMRNVKTVSASNKEAFLQFHKAYLASKRNVFTITRR